MNYNYSNLDLNGFYYSSITLTVAYAFFYIVLERLVVKRLKDSKTRYNARKSLSFIYFIVSFIVILRIWIPNPQALLVSYGLIGAGVAIALQDFFKNIVGGLTILFGSIYRAGDRIEINSKYGDVLDVSLFYTTLLEIREWVAGDQATGRIITVPNSFVLSSPLHNYTKDHSFIWDEIKLPVTYESDWEKAIKLVLEILKTETEEATRRAEKELTYFDERYYLSKRNVEPSVYVQATDNWIMLNIRYITDVRERRVTNDKLTRLILRSFDEHKDIKVASSTVAIVDFPNQNQ